MRLATILATILTASTSAHAYTYVTSSSNFSGWPGTSVLLWYDPSIGNNPAYLEAFSDALHAWDDGPQNMNVIGRALSVAYKRDNGRNEIAMIPHKADIGNRPGVALYDYDANGVLTETDLLFAEDWGFTTSNLRSDLKHYGGTKRSLRGVMIHELGHFLGLGHETDTYNIMGDDSTHARANGAYATWYAGEDATRGLVNLYGGNGLQDVAVSHWHRCGYSGEYSSHCRNGIEDAAGNALTQYSEAGEPIYLLARGQSYYPMATLENMGTATQVVTVRYQLSPNNVIGSSDVNLISVTKTLSPDAVLEYQGAKITIPTTLATGDYWLGVFVDPENAVAEWNESNNRGYLTKVRIQ